MALDVKKIEEGNTLLAEKVSSLFITTEIQYVEGASLRGVIKERIKKLDEARTLMTRPYLQKQREVNTLFKTYLDPLADLLRTLDQGMLAYKKEEEEAAKKQNALSDVPLPAPERSTRTEKGLTSLKKVWKGEVVDRAKAFRANPDLFIVDQSKVNLMAKIIQAEKEVDGVRIYAEDILSTRL